LTVRTINLDHLNPFTMKMPGQTNPIRSRALHPDTDHRTESCEPASQTPITGSIRWERLDSQHGTVGIHSCSYVHIGVGIHTTNNTPYH
jgi:hypothetical protein